MFDIDRPYTVVFSPEILQVVAQHAGNPVRITHLEYDLMVMEHTTKLTDRSPKSVECYAFRRFLFLSAETCEKYFRARFTNWFNERNRLPFDVIQI